MNTLDILLHALLDHARLFGLRFAADPAAMPAILDRLADWCDACAQPERARAALLEAIDAETEPEAIGRLLLAVAIVKDRPALFADLHRVAQAHTARATLTTTC